MLGVTGFNVREDVRHERRVLTDDELARLIEAAEVGPVVYRMEGPLRNGISGGRRLGIQSE